MIDKYSFGKIRIQGIDYTEDLKIFRGNIVPGWWRKKGHRISEPDVLDILLAKPAVLVVGKGKPGLLRVDQELKTRLEQENIELIELSTSKAVHEFNRLINEGVDVAGGFHLGC